MVATKKLNKSKVMSKPVKKVVKEIEEDIEDLEDEFDTTDEEENTEEETRSEDDEIEDSNDEYNEDDRPEGNTLNVQWLQKIEQNQKALNRKLDQKIQELMDNQPDFQEMITETLKETLAGMSLFRISPKSQVKKPAQKSAVGQKAVKTKQPEIQTRKPLFSKRRK